jgi:hypothetical protein
LRRDVADDERYLSRGDLSKTEAANVRQQVEEARNELAEIDRAIKRGTVLYRVGQETLRDRGGEITADSAINPAILMLRMAQSVSAMN